MDPRFDPPTHQTIRLVSGYRLMYYVHYTSTNIHAKYMVGFTCGNQVQRANNRSMYDLYNLILS